MTDALSSIPEVHISPAVAASMVRFGEDWSISQLEQALLSRDASLMAAVNASINEPWRHLALQASQLWTSLDHVILRGAPVDDIGIMTIILGTVLSSRFRPYRNTQIVKYFKMSPWTTELSQTMQDGHFHTDLNTDSVPPCVTVIHCKKPDPSPYHGLVRVARLEALLNHLRDQGRHSTLRFMCETDVEMVNERARGSWLGPIVDGAKVRFHPETLRASARRGGKVPSDLEEHLEVVHESALAVSTPIVLERGDALLVSNTHALHYRGECTARFFDFPRGFEAREIFVLHLVDEPQWPA